MVRVLAALACPVIANAAPAILHYRFRITDKLHEFEIASMEAAMADPVENCDQFYGGAGSPDFLYIEGEASPRSVASSGLFINELAKKHKAMVVSLEHRRQIPTVPGPQHGRPPVPCADQALADLVRFQDYFAAKQNLTKSKWVAFGGSYPGMLATWLKLKCLSRDIVSQGLRYCGGDKLVASDQADDAATLKALYNPCTPFTNDDDRSVFETQVFGAFQGAAQYAADGTTDLTRICNKIAAFSVTPVETLSQFVGTTGGDTCSYSDLPRRVCSCTAPSQSSSTNCARLCLTSPTTMPVLRQLIDVRRMEINVDNVIFPTGTIDPWDGLALNNKTGVVNSKSEVVDIQGTSHCRAMFSRSGHVVWAHERIESAIDGFLRNQC
ncbi:hypothetical protein H310_10492 [Aphanomyces invadans]|uniref:Peptidase S33 tripeptidyl aminopeptidase-like C-terminal domain-containing protein n=1 Tax=Aphanomyces invadans TaxID=157072 RepID=A0A024TQB6_9STRA|nr:hypothetical protein H310_10492 [Aphanomyces invadans]ETV96330.1 hypothetical protein H310_10492 [Aphanomyces invadans]|eukprot:XP_008875122.1 hypothetical protein H310_10492 [Aphanomyces invadans]